MHVKHEIIISSEELKVLPKIISNEKKLGFELNDMYKTGPVDAIHGMFIVPRYTLIFTEIVKKGGTRNEKK